MLGSSIYYKFLKKGDLNIVMGYLFYKTTLLKALCTTNSEEERLKLCYGFFLTKAHFKKQHLLQISEEGYLKHCYGIFVL